MGLISEAVEKHQFLTIATPNPEQVVLSQENQSFLQVLHSFDVLLPDGQGIVWAAKRQNKNLARRITGIEVADMIISQAKANNWRVLVVGGQDYLPDVPAEESAELFANVWWMSNVKPKSTEHETQLQHVLTKIKPDIVLVALGAPKQENWVMHHRQQLQEAGVEVAMVVGGAVDVIMGKVIRAPLWMQNWGLEWVWRLIQQPWRWKRQLGLVKFIKLVVFN